MPVLISWDDDAKTTLRYQYEGKWTWDEVDTATDEVVALMRVTTHSVSIIHDMTRSPGLPSGALTGRTAARDLPENWDISVVVGSGVITEALLNIFTRVYKKLGEHYKTASSPGDEARAIIAAQKAKNDRC
ncbi:MAG: hypothetical protein U0703_00940 [Anaerolineae bacterium]